MCSTEVHEAHVTVTVTVTCSYCLFHLQKHAAAATAHISRWGAEHLPAIVSAGAIPPLVRLLGGPDKDAQV